MTDDVMTVDEAAARLKIVDPEWLRRQLRARRIPGHKVAGKWRLTEADFQAALDVWYQAPTKPETDSWGLSPTAPKRLAR